MASFKPVGVNSDSLFPTRVMTALKGLFSLKTDVEPKGLSIETQTSLKATYLTYDGTHVLNNGTVISISGSGGGSSVADLGNGLGSLTSSTLTNLGNGLASVA